MTGRFLELSSTTLKIDGIAIWFTKDVSKSTGLEFKLHTLAEWIRNVPE